MPDIMKFIRDEDAQKTDPEGNLIGDEEWSEAAAREVAAAEGVEMSDDHWAVVRCVREFYREHGEVRHARQLLDTLDDEFAAQGGKKFLYRLFPRGPVGQACRIGGIPAPADSADPSFGTSQ